MKRLRERLALEERAQLPSRADIRHLAALHHAAIRAAVREGGNPHHLVLDQADTLKAYAALLPTHEGDALLRMYAEEVRAIATLTESEPATDAVARDVVSKQGAATWVTLLALAAMFLAYRSC